MRFEHYDPDWPSRLHETFDRLKAFTPELTEAPRPRSNPKPVEESAYAYKDIRATYERVVTGAAEFSFRDVEEICNYGKFVAIVARRSLGESPSQHLAQMISRAASNLEATCAQFRQFVVQSGVSV